jgi:hypothetical protein
MSESKVSIRRNLVIEQYNQVAQKARYSSLKEWKRKGGATGESR